MENEIIVRNILIQMKILSTVVDSNYESKGSVFFEILQYPSISYGSWLDVIC